MSYDAMSGPTLKALLDATLAEFLAAILAKDSGKVTAAQEVIKELEMAMKGRNQPELTSPSPRLVAADTRGTRDIRAARDRICYEFRANGSCTRVGCRFRHAPRAPSRS